MDLSFIAKGKMRSLSKLNTISLVVQIYFGGLGFLW